MPSNPRSVLSSPEEEICITGISGEFPNSKNMNELEYNLYNKINMVDDINRWTSNSPEIPKRMGNIGTLAKFDAQFFGIHFKQAHAMDPQGRMLIEKAYEAILDAGIHPKKMKGSKTAVFIGTSSVESEQTWIYERNSEGGFGLTGISRSMLANRISYALDLHGPSAAIDSACSGSMYALDFAFSAIKNGECDSALVGGCNLLLFPNITLQFIRLGVLAKDGICRPFDENSSGYSRSETVCVLFLQKAKDAKRVYAKILHSKTNCDGYKAEGITFPSSKGQQGLFSEFYRDINIDPAKVQFVEAHSTGTIVGDPEECHAISTIFCKNRNEPLLIGSVKSNLGHSEAASSMCSLAKIILACERSEVAPNINFKSNRKGVKSLEENKLRVCTEITKLVDPLIALSSFGFGGSNAHALLAQHSKVKVNDGAPSDLLPRLVNWAGRTQEAVDFVLEALSSQPLDVEFIGLLHNIQSVDEPGFIYRGYSILNHENKSNAICLESNTKLYTGEKRPIVFMYSGMGSQWNGMGKSLMQLPIFKSSIDKCHNVLTPFGVDLYSILTTDDQTVFDNSVNSFVGIAAVQIGITDLLKELEISPDYIIGHSVGEVGCGYADGSLTLAQAMLSAYYRGFASTAARNLIPKGAMAAVGRGYKDIVGMLPENVEIACHNSSDSCTISGLEKNVRDFMSQLTKLNIFVKEVNANNIPYHTRLVKEIGKVLFVKLEKVLARPCKRSSKWISTSVPKHCWNETMNQFASADYFVNNLLGTVLFEEGILELPDKSIMLEIAPHGLLQAIVKKSLLNTIHVPTTHRGHPNNLAFFLGAIGILYTNGRIMPIHKLYPEIEFPVSRLTPKIAPLIKWQHNEDWFVTNSSTDAGMSGERKYQIKIANEFAYLIGHQIDGRVLFPATGYLDIVWQTLASVKRLIYTEMDVEFEDVRFLRVTNVPLKQNLYLTVMLHYGTGRFEISEKSMPVVTGTIRLLPPKTPLTELPPIPENDCPLMTDKDFYRELRIRGYQYNGEFQSVTEARTDILCGRIKWTKNWVSFMDCLLQMNILGKDSRSLYLPTRIRKLRICTMTHSASVDSRDSSISVQVCPELAIIQAGGVEIIGMSANAVSRRNMPGNLIRAHYNFIPQYPTPVLEAIDALRVCCQLALENGIKSKFRGLEVLVSHLEPIIDKVSAILLEIPQITADLFLMRRRSEKEIEMKNVIVIKDTLSNQKNNSLIIASGCCSNLRYLAEVNESLIKGGFLISRENHVKFTESHIMGFNVIANVQLINENFILLQKNQGNIDTIPTVIHVNSNDIQLNWLNQLKKSIGSIGSIKSIGKDSIILVAQNDQFSGLLGLFNCLRKEKLFSSIRMVFINDSNAPPFDLNNEFYQHQLKRGCAVNIYNNGKWGSYRFSQLVQRIAEIPQYDHCYASLLKKGDLSTFSWCKGPLRIQKINKNVAHVQYASLNFRDVMLATGKLSADVVCKNRLNLENLVGFEISGIDSDGRRIMGMLRPGALSTFAEYEETVKFLVPDSMSLEEAATIPTVYITVYCAFFMHNPISKGKSILIHAGSGGVGLAAITVALAYGMEVFTTVSNDDKKNFILEQFPSLKESHIGNSRDCTFERMVTIMTKGKGVDFVLNSLSEEKLKASIRCLGHHGTFLEIGKFDMVNNNEIGLESFLKELTFRSIMVDNYELLEPSQQNLIRILIEKDLKNGIIKPLPVTVFNVNEIEKAFRYLSTGKHVGKVVIKIRSDPFDKYSAPMKVLPRCYFDDDKVYIISGGLGGFGLELTDWMILRGARKIVLISRSGVSNGYQEHRIRLWKSYGCQIIVNTNDITTLLGCQAAFRESTKYGPIDGIFNLAAVLRDGTIETQTPQSFNECMAPKAEATKCLDQLSRKECPNLSYFVVFSSISCGHGNAGQSNYGMANSIMERIIERRVLDGLSGKAIQWGAVGEVGLVAEMTNGRLDIEIAGTLQQPISSCLTELDILLSTPEPIVQCMMTSDKTFKSSMSMNIIESVMNIMGIQDTKSIPIGVSLSDLGMDSLMATEILQTLEREFDLTLPLGELRVMTLTKLQELSENSVENIDPGQNTNVTQRLFDFKRLIENSESTEKLFYPLDSRNKHKAASAVILLHGIEGINELWNTLSINIDMPTFMVNFADHIESLRDFVDTVFMDIMDVFKSKEYFYIVAYSFGSIVAMEIARRLENSNKQGQIIFVDSSPKFVQKIYSNFIQTSDASDESLQIELISTIIREILPTEDMQQLRHKTSNYSSWSSKLNYLADIAHDVNYDFNQSIRLKCTGLYRRLKAIVENSLLEILKIKSPITLIRSNMAIVDIEEDYQLSQYTEGKVVVKFIDGSHQTILQNPTLLSIINELDPNEEVHKD